ncbi:MAG: outer membrane lipoprotein carrier protein LolA [Spirochaetaceae bacterium]|nr:outer membrane lipoprotein carrier protein LolA [Spirochaetaceae bacterium]
MVSAQNITTASAFFQSVSEKYGTISDYEADMDIVVSGTTSETKVSFKRPNLLRIDYSKPAEKVIVFNGDTLTIYVPEIPATMTQTLPSSSDSAGMNLATPQGLALMSRYYTIGYEVGQNAVPLDDSSDELVIKLVLYPKSAVEGFRTIKLAISPDTKLIRRVEAVSNQGQVFVFLFSNYVLNQGITDQRFVYDAPSSTNTFNNFLFSE